MVKNGVINIFSLKNYLASLGVTTSSEMDAAIAKWDALYKNNGRLSISASVASELARMVTLEMKSKISGSERAELLNLTYQNVLTDIRTVTEYACAKGGIVLKPYVEDGKIKVSYVQAENFVPLEYDDSGVIKAAAFIDRFIKENKVYTRIECHGFENGVYKIKNSAFVSTLGGDLGRKIPLKEAFGWSNIEPEIAATGIKKPLFAYFKMPMANSIEPSSPLGMSVYSKAIPLIEDAEAQYARLLWEFESGERALYVDETAIRKGSDNSSYLPSKRLYRMLNFGDDGLFEDWTPTLREESIINGLNEILRRVEFSVGLAYGTLSDVGDVEKTAEEFRASKQRSYTQVSDIQNALKRALSELCEAMDVLCDLYNLAPDGSCNISFDFDDSIVADRQIEFDEKMRLLDSGIIEPWEMRAWYFGEEESTARDKISAAFIKNRKDERKGVK